MREGRPPGETSSDPPPPSSFEPNTTNAETSACWPQQARTGELECGCRETEPWLVRIQARPVERLRRRPITAEPHQVHAPLDDHDVLAPSKDVSEPGASKRIERQPGVQS